MGASSGSFNTCDGKRTPCGRIEGSSRRLCCETYRLPQPPARQHRREERMHHMATERWTAYWTMAPRHGVLRTEPARTPSADEALVRTLCSGISRGTEMLVHAGYVPPEVAESMRAPFQVGSWPGPVKYGYLSVGV